jgi:hypothetical protein
MRSILKFLEFDGCDLYNLKCSNALINQIFPQIHMESNYACIFCHTVMILVATLITGHVLLCVCMLVRDPFWNWVDPLYKTQLFSMFNQLEPPYSSYSPELYPLGYVDYFV